MRVVLVTVSSFWLQMVFRGHDYSRMSTDWPDDAEITNATWDQSRGCIVLTVQSATFDEVPFGNIIPEWSPTITKHLDETAALISMTMRGMEEATDS